MSKEGMSESVIGMLIQIYTNIPVRRHLETVFVTT